MIAVPSRSSVSSNAVCERTGAKTVAREAGARLTAARSPADALPVGDGRVEGLELDAALLR